MGQSGGMSGFMGLPAWTNALPFMWPMAIGQTVAQGVKSLVTAPATAKSDAQSLADQQKATMGQQVKAADDQTKVNNKAQADNASSTQAQAIAALRAAMSASTASGGTILGGGMGGGALPAPTQVKTLLGA